MKGLSMPRAAVRIAIVATLLSVSSAGFAADDRNSVTETPELVKGLFSCREIVDSNERLACFDREVDAVYQAREREELVIADKEQVQEARRGLFGFTLPKIGLFSGKKEEDVNSITSTITSLRKMSDGKLTFTIEGGARWRQTDNVKVLGKPGPGDTIEIKRGAIGSYMAKINGRRAFRAKRVD